MLVRMSKLIVIIGGGVTGLGIAAEAAKKGYRVTLVERDEIGSGTSGSFHGILHSGTRYAVNEPDVARECYQENQRLRQLIPEAVVDTGGMFVAMNETEAAYADVIMQAAEKVGLPTKELSLEEARQREPQLGPNLKRAFLVPDAWVDGKKVLEYCKAQAAQAPQPAIVIEHHAVRGFNKTDNVITSVMVENTQTGEAEQLECDYVINAAGVWSGRVAKLASVDFSMVFDKGSMIVFEEQFTSLVLNRCRPENDGDLLVPDGEHSIMGTTARVIDDPDEAEPTQEDIDSLLSDGIEMVPALAGAAVKRVYAGVRPLMQQGEIVSGKTTRSLSRSFQVLDHADQGVSNFMSVVGGKVTVYRLMAERAVQLLDAKLG